jgi:MoaA/NifB/PqqE/SkfB family radical SAM enzyme/glycosyltransferase involved in cell wall biosynthesis
MTGRNRVVSSLAMRVCILTRSDLFPANHGAAVKITQTARWLSTLSGGPCFVVTDDRESYLRFDGEAVSRCSYSLRHRAMQEWPLLRGGLAERLCALAGYPKEEYFLYSPLFDPSWLVRALAVGRTEGIDVFQAEFPGYGIPAALAARILRAVRGGRYPLSSIVQHNVEWDRLAEFGQDLPAAKMLEVAALRMVDEVVAVSEDDRSKMVEAGVPGRSITVIPHGVECGAFHAARGQGRRIRSEREIPEDAPLLFFHGTLHYWPNTEAVRFIAESLLPLLLPTHPTLRVLICGMNPPLYYSHPAIDFTGSVEELAPYIDAADVCLCPIFAGGGTRLKLLEYMAAGKPVVSTAKGAEGIPHEGRLRIAETAEEMAAVLLSLVSDPLERVRLGAAGRRFAQRLDWPEVVRPYLGLYRGEGRGTDWSRVLLEQEPEQETPLSPIDGHLPPRQPSKERTLLLLVNRGCNLRCSFCDLWEGMENMEPERLWPVLDDAVEIGTKTLVITGGEPLLHPSIFDIVRGAKARGLSVNLTTNGTLVERRWAELLACGLDSVSFSIDGVEETHDRLRGRKGAWSQTVAALERLRSETTIHASVYFVATRENVGELLQTYELARSVGASFDFWPVNDAEDLYIRSPADRQAWLDAVEAISSKEPEVARRKAFYMDSLRYHSGGLEGNALRCLGFIDQYGITYDGRFLPCCVWGAEGISAGNVFERPLRELWYSSDVREKRERLHSEGCTAGCFNHSLYEFTESTGLPFRL